MMFLEQRAHDFKVWSEPMINLRMPLIFDLRQNPFERAMDESIGYDRWMIDRVLLLVPAQVTVGAFLQTFKEFPPRQRPASFNVDQVVKQLMDWDNAMY